MNMPLLPVKVNGVWRNCEQGMCAISDHVFSEGFPQILVVSSYEQWRGQVEEKIERRLLQNQHHLYNRPYDIWLISKEHAGFYKSLSQKDRTIERMVEFTGFPYLPNLFETDPVESFEQLIKELGG